MLSSLVFRLTQETGQAVINKTGLTGHYDIDLEWASERFAPRPDATAGPAPGFGGPSIFTALREQLGLKLESTKGPVDVLVIDHVEQPTPD
jgi:uncharacterized protein (TIGR03435 family)